MHGAWFLLLRTMILLPAAAFRHRERKFTTMAVQSDYTVVKSLDRKYTIRCCASWAGVSNSVDAKWSWILHIKQLQIIHWIQINYKKCGKAYQLVSNPIEHSPKYACFTILGKFHNGTHTKTNPNPNTLSHPNPSASKCTMNLCSTFPPSLLRGNGTSGKAWCRQIRCMLELSRWHHSRRMG